MAGSVNKVILIGNLGADPEIRRTQDGRPIANLRVATSESWRDKATGERREKTEWHRVVIFSEGLCRVVEQYLKKGAKVYIEGQLQTRKWTDQQGVERYSTEIVLQNYNSTLTMLDKAGGGAATFTRTRAVRAATSAPRVRAPRARRHPPWRAAASAAIWTTKSRSDLPIPAAWRRQSRSGKRRKHESGLGLGGISFHSFGLGWGDARDCCKGRAQAR